MSQVGRVLILGATGQLGRELQSRFAGLGEIVCIGRCQCDIADSEQLRAVIRATGPDLILNAAAYTAVDKAENERVLATAVNTVAPRVLAEEARRRDILLVHYSTDYVFDGSKRGAWVETDSPNPLNHYGASKLAGEKAIAQVGGKYLIFRTSWVYSPHGKNFLVTMLRLGRERDRLTIVNDQIGAPTTSVAIADATRTIVDGILRGQFGGVQNWAGLYHMSCGGSTSWCDFAEDIFARALEHSGWAKPDITPISTEHWPSPARRPLNSMLSNQKLMERFGVQLPNWKTELDAAMKQVSTDSQGPAALHSQVKPETV